MSTHAVTQTSTWDGTPPQVPDGSSSSGNPSNTMGNATAVIQAFVTKFANRTLYLYNTLASLTSTVTALDGAAARKAGGNAFTGNQSLAGNVSVTGGGNTFTTAGNATIGGTLTANKLTVTDNVNLNGNAITIPNASITQTSGSLHLTNGGIDAGGNVETKGGDLMLPGTKRVKYTGTTGDRTRQRRVRMSCGVSPQPNTGANSVAFTGDHWIASNTAYTLSIPLPPYGAFTEVTALWLRYAAAGAGGTVELMRSSIGDWLVTPGGATPTVTSLGSANLVTTGSGVKTAILTLGTPEVISNTAYDYWIKVTGNSGSNHDIYGAFVTVTAYTPGID